MVLLIYMIDTKDKGKQLLKMHKLFESDNEPGKT